MRRMLCFILLAASGQFCVAQKNTGNIRGRVLTADGSPAYVTVELKQLKKITVTDSKGNFILAGLPALTDTIVFTAVGAKTHFEPISLQQGALLNLGDLRLTFNIAQLQDIEVAGRIAHSYKSDYSFLGTKIQTAAVDIPQAISSITKEMIKDRMDYTLKDAADEAAGVNQYSGFDEYTIRGFKAENARMINGLRGYNTTYTSAMLVNVERIEVVKGPAATLYGNCDPGGTINLVTKKPLAKNEGSINISGGSWDHFRAQGDITGPLNASKTLLYRFNAGNDDTHSFRDQWYARSYELAPSLSYIPNSRVQLNIDFSLSHINTLLDRGQPGVQNDQSLQSTPISLNVSQPGDYLHETDAASNIIFSYKINKHIHFNSGYLNYITQQNVAEHGVQGYATPDVVNLYYSNWKYHTITHTFTDYFTFRFNTGKLNHQFLAGYDLVISDVNLVQKYYELPDQFGTGSGIVAQFNLRNPENIVRQTGKYQASAYQSDASNVEGSVYHTQGIYVQEQVSLNKLKLLIGLREELYAAGDDDDTTDQSKVNIFLPRLGLVYALRPDISLYGTYNKGFDPFEASTSTQIFDAPFKPVTSNLLEVGAKANFFASKLSASVALYQLALQNVAVNANVIANPNLYIQQGEERSRGVETEVNGNIFPNLSIAAAYSHCVATIVKSKIPAEQGTLIENAPKNTSNSWIKYTFVKGALRGFGIAAGHSQVSQRNTLVQGFTLPGYVVMNGGIRYTCGHFNAAINLNNIGNKTYWVGAYNNVSKWPGTPRNFMMNIGYAF